jgi:hypothetical protein
MILSACRGSVESAQDHGVKELHYRKANTPCKFISRLGFCYLFSTVRFVYIFMGALQKELNRPDGGCAHWCWSNSSIFFVDDVQRIKALPMREIFVEDRDGTASQ